MTGTPRVRSGWALAPCLLAACAAQPPAPASWVGATEAELVGRFGKPSATLVNEDGNQVIIFTAASTLFFGTGEPCDGFSEDACRLKGNLVLNQEDTGQRAIVARCSVFFEIDDGRVAKWTWGGRLCNRVFDSSFMRKGSAIVAPKTADD